MKATHIPYCVLFEQIYASIVFEQFLVDSFRILLEGNITIAVSVLPYTYWSPLGGNMRQKTIN